MSYRERTRPMLHAQAARDQNLSPPQPGRILASHGEPGGRHADLRLSLLAVVLALLLCCWLLL